MNADKRLLAGALCTEVLQRREAELRSDIYLAECNELTEIIVHGRTGIVIPAVATATAQRNKSAAASSSLLSSNSDSDAADEQRILRHVMVSEFLMRKEAECRLTVCKDFRSSWSRMLVGMMLVDESDERKPPLLRNRLMLELRSQLRHTLLVVIMPQRQETLQRSAIIVESAANLAAAAVVDVAAAAAPQFNSNKSNNNNNVPSVPPVGTNYHELKVLNSVLTQARLAQAELEDRAEVISEAQLDRRRLVLIEMQQRILASSSSTKRTAKTAATAVTTTKPKQEAQQQQPPRQQQQRPRASTTTNAQVALALALDGDSSITDEQMERLAAEQERKHAILLLQRTFRRFRSLWNDVLPTIRQRRGGELRRLDRRVEAMISEQNWAAYIIGKAFRDKLARLRGSETQVVGAFVDGGGNSNSNDAQKKSNQQRKGDLFKKKQVGEIPLATTVRDALALAQVFDAAMIEDAQRMNSPLLAVESFREQQKLAHLIKERRLQRIREKELEQQQGPMALLRRQQEQEALGHVNQMASGVFYIHDNKTATAAAKITKPVVGDEEIWREYNEKATFRYRFLFGLHALYDTVVQHRPRSFIGQLMLQGGGVQSRWPSSFRECINAANITLGGRGDGAKPPTREMVCFKGVEQDLAMQEELRRQQQERKLQPPPTSKKRIALLRSCYSERQRDALARQESLEQQLHHYPLLAQQEEDLHAFHPLEIDDQPHQQQQQHQEQVDFTILLPSSQQQQQEQSRTQPPQLPALLNLAESGNNSLNPHQQQQHYYSASTPSGQSGGGRSWGDEEILWSAAEQAPIAPGMPARDNSSSSPSLQQSPKHAPVSRQQQQQLIPTNKAFSPDPTQQRRTQQQHQQQYYYQFDEQNQQQQQMPPRAKTNSPERKMRQRLLAIAQSERLEAERQAEWMLPHYATEKAPATLEELLSRKSINPVTVMDTLGEGADFGVATRFHVAREEICEHLQRFNLELGKRCNGRNGGGLKLEGSPLVSRRKRLQMQENAHQQSLRKSLSPMNSTSGQSREKKQMVQQQQQEQQEVLQRESSLLPRVVEQQRRSVSPIQHQQQRHVVPTATATTTAAAGLSIEAQRVGVSSSSLSHSPSGSVARLRNAVRQG